MQKKFKLSRNSKFALQIICGFTLALVTIPVLFVMALSNRGEDEITTFTTWNATTKQTDTEQFYITVYRTETSVFETIEFERYIIGVVAAEMPALFEMDALRAQAIVARTYATRILEHDEYILDTIMHQVFLDDEQLRTRWGDSFEIHHATIEEAVKSTKGIILTYDDEPITAMFFAMSNGATENSEDVFGTSRPYLRSVPSTGYEGRADFEVKEYFNLDTLRNAFNDNEITADNIMILNHSEGGNVANVTIGTKNYTGRQVREILGLRSAAFTITLTEDHATFTTHGNGHGVGMSQHGANIMAQKGHNYEEILQHFYQNVTLVEKKFINVE